MSAKHEKRDITIGFLIVGAILAFFAIQIVRFADRYVEIVNAGFYIGIVIFALGVILVAAYVLYYD
ncbi:MAG: hypothetical protein LUQ27_03350 [Methanomassiliicoccales archaeon]|nr:hypothetical protein [Methanomassiliicoccales archaeon]